jgi:3-keto-5-aminohexanoate cleavage enzyme
MYLLSQLPPGLSWTVAGIGAAQLPLATLAVVLGGHVRVGFEDNIYFRRGELAQQQRAVRRARGRDRPPARPCPGHARPGAGDAGHRAP